MTEKQFTRQTHPTSYIAYEAKPSKPQRLMVDGAAKNQPVHPEVFIREIVSTKIASIKEPRATSQRTPSLHVELDASSMRGADGELLRMSENFGGSIQAGSKLEEVVRHAHANGIDMYVAIETKRKYRNRSTSEVIPFFTSINTLRGATPDGRGQSESAGMTRDNCSNVIVAIGPVDQPAVTFISGEATTDPYTWDEVRSNRDGTMPPAGFEHAVDEHGAVTSAIIPGTGATAKGTAAGGGAEAADVAAAVVKMLQDQGIIAAASVRPAERGSRAVEGRGWEAFNSDGRINPGSYLASGVRHTWAAAAGMVESAQYAEHDASQAEGRPPALLTAEGVQEATARLVPVLLWAADKVQHEVVGATDRMARSHREASQWVQQMATGATPCTVAMLGSSEESKAQAKAWMMGVIAMAKGAYTDALAMVSTYAESRYGVQAPPSDASRGGREESARQNPPVDPASQQAPAETGQPATDAEPGDQPAPATAQPAAPLTGSTADHPELHARWEALLTQIGMGNHVADFNPLLIRAFESSDPRAIPAAEFVDMLTDWEANPEAFKGLGQAAYMDAQAAGSQMANA